MRKIVKGREPEELRLWKQNEVPENRTYGNMPKREVKVQMLGEQGHLCAYTMQRISTLDDCHIEHIIPRSQNRELEITYSNLLACYPGNRPSPGSVPRKCPFGAEEKDQTPVYENNFVSPLREDVESRFRYTADGSVAPSHNDEAAENTISILRLDHQQLGDLRKAAIDERIFPQEVVLSSQEAEDLSRAIMTPDATGRLPEFCLAISQVAAWYANATSGGS